jgi:hypothetical protein
MQAFEFLSPLADFHKSGFRSYRDDMLGVLHGFLLSWDIFGMVFS